MIPITPSQRELAEETLGLLSEYISELGPLSRRLADNLQSGRAADLSRLLDGIELITESMGQLRMALEIEGPAPAMALEAELTDLLRGLVASIEARIPAEQVRILGTLLPEQLLRWESEGIASYRRTIEAPPTAGPG